MIDIILFLDNVRSAHNVGSMLRTAEGLGLKRVIASGISPYPRQPGDKRLPHVIASAERKLAKTALGAEKFLQVSHTTDSVATLLALKRDGYRLVGLEQSPRAQDLRDYKIKHPLVLVVGNERVGLAENVQELMDELVAIPMAGKKESFNVAAAAAIALYQLTTVNVA